MQELYFVLYLLAGVCFGLAAGGVFHKRVNFLAFGLLFWVVVEVIQTFQKL